MLFRSPLAMAAGLATLALLADGAPWRAAERWAASAEEILTRAARAAGVPLIVQRSGTILTPFFTAAPVRDFAGAKASDRAAYARFFHHMLNHGVYLPPSPFEAAFTSAAHGAAELAIFDSAVSTAFTRLAA